MQTTSEYQNRLAIYDRIVRIRATMIAPVDVTGAGVVASVDVPASVSADAIASKSAMSEEVRFKVLVALIISARTRDQVVYQTIDRIETAIGCTLISFVNATEIEIAELIRSTTFFEKKANYLKRSAEMIHTTFRSIIPTDKRELLRLPGVGEKTASLFLNKTSIIQDEVPESIAIDTHLARIFQRLRWTEKTDPTAIAREVESWLPKHLRKDINQIVVGFGQVVCKAQPLCQICPIKDMCSSCDHSRDIEDIGLIVRQVRSNQMSLINEFGPPRGEAVWSLASGEKLKTGWLPDVAG